jgi:hypothetical protein
MVAAGAMTVRADEPTEASGDPLQPAIRAAIENGVATLLARQTAPGNPTSLVFPAMPREVETVTLRYSWQTIQRPAFRNITERRLVAVTDEYGNPAGMAMRNIVVRREIIGTQEERRLIRDDNGNIERTQRRVIYGQGAEARVPHGLIAINGMALYVYAKAGLPRHEHPAALASDLVSLVNQTGLPDMTVDLAWLAAGLIAHDESSHRPLLDRVLGRLIDGQIRERGDAALPGAGMWGPVCIHYPLLAATIDAEFQLNNQIAPLEARLEKGEQLSRAEMANLQRLQDRRNQLARQFSDVSMHGRRLDRVAHDYLVGEQWILPRLPHSPYRYVLADMDSTAVAAFALSEAQKSGVLPQRTHRVTVGSRPLAQPEVTANALNAAIRAVTQQQQAHGGWHASNALLINSIFANSPIGRARDIREDGHTLTLISPETLRSNLTGVAALVHLNRAAGRDQPAIRQAWTRALPRMNEVVQAWLTAPQQTYSRRVLFSGVTDSPEELAAARGLPDRQPPSNDPSELPFGGFVTPYDLLHGAMALVRQPTDPVTDDALSHNVYRQVATWLVHQQNTHGQWDDSGRQPLVSSSVHADRLRQEGARIAVQNQRLSREPGSLDRNRRLLAMQEVHDNPPRGLYATLQALTFLLERPLDESVDPQKLAILPDPHEMSTEDEVFDPESMMPDDAVSGLERPNPHVAALAGHEN